MHHRVFTAHDFLLYIPRYTKKNDRGKIIAVSSYIKTEPLVKERTLESGN